MKEQEPIQDNINTNVEEELEMSDNVNQEHTTDENSTAEEAVANEQQTSEASSAEGSNTEAEALRAELEEQQQRLLRAQADFDNFRRRTQKEKEELGKYASAKLITELLPVIDNFERAIASGEQGTDVSSYAKGVEMIFRQLEGVLGNEGLKAMETVGEPFNPEFHQAIMQVESDEHEEGIVVEEVQKGYMLKDKVIRPAMVKVSG
ncbi:nucleotide exchange factor GrpE [Paenibacillus woosongensis]|uniref:Protein GrpE n=1 Tax=Paenibacillus woosongensis TaxID=307580 RepID=A0ABQ4MP17_9BACL|nr:nucleotide exchange factor GrpE [Paenibacillus woosongensis]GIP57718.1 nucleotide exchange factor GrpE [Paenibacillus woosongensis]